jgi:excinuclease UvrABC nuclease subunit
MTDTFTDHKAQRSAALQAYEDARSTSGLPAEIPADSGHVVYVAKAIDGAVLYVGMTRNLWQRVAAHHSKAPWFRDAHAFTIIPCQSVRAAQRLESILIFELAPLYNIR